MNNLSHRIVVIAVAVAAILIGSPRAGQAQLKGHYIPGFTGLGNGTQPPPSITFALPVYFYTTDTIRDDNGDPLGENPRINASFLGGSVICVTNVKFLGANWGFQAVPVDFMKSRIEGPSLDVPGSFAFSDITFQPLWLGWHKPRADFTLGWSFFAPTGKYELNGSDNSGLGMWSNDFQAGTTLHLDAEHAWTTSLLATYEIHSHKEDSDVKVGDILTLEGGTGKTFYKKVEGTPIPRITSVGLAYYGQFKVNADTGGGPLADRLLFGRKDRVLGVGVEGSVFLPKQKLLLGLRVIPELGARNRTSGWTFLLSLAYQAKSLVKLPEQP